MLTQCVTITTDMVVEANTDFWQGCLVNASDKSLGIVFSRMKFPDRKHILICFNGTSCWIEWSIGINTLLLVKRRVPGVNGDTGLPVAAPAGFRACKCLGILFWIDIGKSIQNVPKIKSSRMLSNPRTEKSIAPNSEAELQSSKKDGIC